MSTLLVLDRTRVVMSEVRYGSLSSFAGRFDRIPCQGITFQTESLTPSRLNKLMYEVLFFFNNPDNPCVVAILASSSCLRAKGYTGSIIVHGGNLLGTAVGIICRDITVDLDLSGFWLVR
jgi:hypothetical protein